MPWTSDGAAQGYHATMKIGVHYLQINMEKKTTAHINKVK